MPVTAKMLRNVMAEARPIIERQMNDAKIIAGFRDLIASNGGDWSALKALIKAHVEDEADDDGEGRRVRKILDKADSSTAYADMLGLAKMNEENFSAASYSEAKGRGIDAAFVNSILVGGELTDNQESGTAGSCNTSPISQAADESEQDDVGATASSTNSNQGRSNGTPLPVETATERQAACSDRPDSLNSSEPPRSNTAGEAPSSSQASPAAPSDDIDLTIPDFLRRTECGYPKREAVDA